jgi:hypothetical protein
VGRGALGAALVIAARRRVAHAERSRSRARAHAARRSGRAQKAGLSGSAQTSRQRCSEGFEKVSVQLFPAAAACSRWGPRRRMVALRAHGARKRSGSAAAPGVPLQRPSGVAVHRRAACCSRGRERASAAGTNAVVFMAALYAVRGAADCGVLRRGCHRCRAPFFCFSVSCSRSTVIFVGALVIGLGDTWLDLRAKARAMTRRQLTGAIR